MTLARLSALQPIVASSGRPTAYLLSLISDIVSAVNEIASAASAAVPATRNVVGVGGLHGGGPLSDEVGLALYRALAPVSRLPSAGLALGDWAFALDGRKPGEAAGAGTGVPVFWSRIGWCSVSGGQVSA